MKEFYPREYELMKEYIKKDVGTFPVVSWDANDALVPSTESFIRNIMLGQEYYRKEFGVRVPIFFFPTVSVSAGLCPLLPLIVA